MSIYSTVSTDLLCRSCKYGQITESYQGHTAVICKAADAPRAVRFVVTKCTDYASKEKGRMWDTAWGVRYDDGALQFRKPDTYEWENYEGVDPSVEQPEPKVSLLQHIFNYFYRQA